MDEIFQYLENGKIIIYVSLACIALTAVINMIFKAFRFIKYIPGLLFTIVGIFNLLLACNSFAEPEGLNYFSLSIVLIVGGLIGILSGLIIGIYNKPYKSKKKKKNITEED
ncbi:MAG: hypothetical protein PHY91_03695 [Tissierellia bacterium]|nr:hypothetical protein [Tissierellia bacterium]